MVGQISQSTTVVGRVNDVPRLTARPTYHAHRKPTRQPIANAINIRYLRSAVLFTVDAMAFNYVVESWSGCGTIPGAAYSICRTRRGLWNLLDAFEDAWMISGRMATIPPLAIKHSTGSSSAATRATSSSVRTPIRWVPESTFSGPLTDVQSSKCRRNARTLFSA